MIATKEQERKALEKIRKIVADLGEGSYIATAFEGCFQDAEDNIEYDAAFSMKARYEHSEKELAEAQKEIAALKEELAESESQLAQTETEISLLNENLERAENSRPAPEDFDGIFQLITSKRFELDIELKNAAGRIVELATEPESAAFKNAVNDHRAAQSEMDRYTALAERLSKIK